MRQAAAKRRTTAARWPMPRWASVTTARAPTPNPGGIMNRLRLAMFVLLAIGISTAAFAVEQSSKQAAPASKTKAASSEAKPTAAVLERGKKLATFGGCVDCHTPGALYGAPDFTRQLSGSELGWSGPWGTTYARNLTPDLETGLGYYKEHEIILA